MHDKFPAHIAKILSDPALFDAQWYSDTYKDVALSGLSPERHYQTFGPMLGRAPNADIQQQIDELPRDAVNANIDAAAQHAAEPPVPAEFDDAFYVQTNPYIDHRKLTPYVHYTRYGHHDLRAPNADFDIVWYLQNYGHTFDVNKIDPFTHYLKKGKAKGYLQHPPRKVTFDKSKSRPLPAKAKRACLFAGYDADGRIDDSVVIYLTELAKHADVFYMADCEMPDSELAKLKGIVKDAWAKRHGAYDFGSYSILARDLVGWKTLATYDEVIFANDSCYLVQPLDETFAKMDKRACAWWGLQATKSIYATRKVQPFPDPSGLLDIDDIKENYLDDFEHDPVYDFHIGSYFMVFRNDVIKDVRFQRVIDAIQGESRKLSIVLKYEVGLTHFLLGHGYEFSTWGQTVTKAHPVYTDVAFDLIARGFPLFKRYILAENPYKVSSVAYWKTALTQANSVTSIAQIEDNYLRTSNADKVYRNFNITQDEVLPLDPMAAAELTAYDRSTPKYDHFWGFPVCFYDQNLSDNARAVFEEVKDDPTIVKVIFTRDRIIKADGVNVICVPLLSREGQIFLTRCRTLFVRHGAKRNLHWPIDAQLHNIINLWHGIPLKRIGTASLDLVQHRAPLQRENSRLRAVISASDVDRLAMNAAYAPLNYDDIWVTGLPRHDFVTKPEKDLPAFLQNQLADIRALTNGRRLILFCPTFRNDQKNGYYNFTPEQVASLTAWLKENNMVLGVREHLADEAKQYSSQLSGDTFVRVQANRFPDIEMLYREAAMLVTDYSSCFIDYMLTDRPMISFAYDLASYKERERGLFYELEDVFPGPIAQDFDNFMTALGSCANQIGSPPSPHYQAQKRFFIKHTDSGNAARVVARAKETCTGSTLPKDFHIDSRYKTPKSIAFLYSVTLDTANRTRIFALIPHLRAMGWTCYAMDINFAAPDILTKTQFVSFCGLELATRTLDLAESVRATGGTVLYDTESFLHDSDLLHQSADFMADPKQANALALKSKRTAQMAMRADAITVATPALLDSVNHLQRPTAVIDNALSQVISDTYSQPRKRGKDPKTHISYLARSAHCAQDFDLCKAALCDLLKERPDVVLHVVAPLDLTEMIESFGPERIRQYGLKPYTAMHAFLRTMDINLAPLADTQPNATKSALKIAEAALHGVPTIAAPNPAYSSVIKDGETGYLAADHDAWSRAIFAAVDDAKARQKIGEAARQTIAPQFAAHRAAQQLADFLERITANDL